MKKQDVKDFLNFRKKFTSREWDELNQAVMYRHNEKAAKLEFDDFDIEVIFNMLEESPFFDMT